MLDVVEYISRGLEDRSRSRAGGGIGRRAGVNGPGLEAVAHVRGGQLMRFGAPVRRRLGCAVADDAGVDAAPRQLAAQTAKFYFRAAVHDDFNARRLGFFSRRVVADSQL